MRKLRFVLPDVAKLHFGFPKFKKNLYIPSILVFTIFVASAFFFHTAFAVVTEGCGMWDVRPGCDLSGWMKLFLGDVGIGAVLAVLLHVFTHRSNTKIEKNAEKLEQIISSQESLRKARRDYAVQNLKNHFTTLLFVMGIINRLASDYNKPTDQKSVIYTKLKTEEARMGRIVQTARNTIVYSSDTLDPTLVSQLDGLCTFVGQISLAEKEGVMELPKYEEAKKKIMEVTRIFQSSKVSSAVFK